MTENKMVLPRESYNGKEIKDSRGRKITLKNPTMLDLYNYNRACMSNGKLDTDLKAMGLTLCYIDKIDSVSLTALTQPMEIISALNKFYADDFIMINDEIEKYKEGLQEEIKK